MCFLSQIFDAEICVAWVGCKPWTRDVSSAKKVLLRLLPESDAASRTSAARALAHVCQLVEFFGGSRVENYFPLLQLATRLAAPPFVTGTCLQTP